MSDVPTRITEELREWADCHDSLVGFQRDDIDAMLERIDGRIEEEYVPLPKDADGNPWHIGDIAEGIYAPSVVNDLMLGDDGWALALQRGTRHFLENSPSVVRHHKPSPAERIRKIAVDKIGNYSESHDDGSTYEYPLRDVALKLLEIADELEGDVE